MFAIVESGGKQYRVEPGGVITVDRMKAEEGSEVVLDRVLMIGGESPAIGTPLVEGTVVKARVREHVRGPKVITFKYKARKRSRRKVGFRAALTTLEILGIES